MTRSQLFVQGDPVPLILDSPADRIVAAVERADPQELIGLAALGPDDKPRTVYVRAGLVAVVTPWVREDDD